MNNEPKTPKTIQLRKWAFRKWLEKRALEPLLTRKIVGWTRRANTCPLANYIKEKTEAKEVTVHIDKFYTDQENSNPLPSWANSFIKEVDKGTSGSPVYALRAIDILDQI
jgi:hypothetical protein